MQDIDGAGAQIPDVCRAIRVGGRGSTTEKHGWDMILVEREDK